MERAVAPEKDQVDLIQREMFERPMEDSLATS
jgi:hypothetical protein